MRTLLSACLALVLAACNASSSTRAQESGLPEHATHVYHEVDGLSLHAYVFTPAVTASGDVPASAILLFHGGGWSVGTPEWTFDAARRFAANGMVAIPIQYRLSEGSVTPIEALEDVCTAFRWAREHAHEFHIDPDRVAGYGVSAGGHLVTTAATVGCPQKEGSAERPEPDVLLLWSPALDMARDG